MERRGHRVRDLAEAYDLNPMTLYRAIYRGDLPALKIGRSVRITEEGIQSYIKSANPPRRSNPGIDVDSIVGDIFNVTLGPRR